ncbi:DUF3054 domain-containing protein, partial [Nocardia sp. NPDC058497]|uniref:DUF3054 domain-containing protein n=1 Tax=Nocardia sp. NPDC058497 TaxID=3346529 RepID=UPI00366311EC
MKKFVPFAADALLVIVFCAIGRRSHDEAVIAGLVKTVWPFGIGLLIGWALAVLVARDTRFDATALWPSGQHVWVGPQVGGMVLGGEIRHGLA